MDLRASLISGIYSATLVMMWLRINRARARAKPLRRPGRISKQGNHRIRRVLHLPAFNAVRFGEPSCQALFERVYQRTGIKMKAYVAVQKKLLLLVYSLWRNQSDYDPTYLLATSTRPESNVSLLDCKKIAPTSGTTRDQLVETELSYL